jgi:tetratricopeptide (TPR) repeat protein
MKLAIRIFLLCGALMGQAQAANANYCGALTFHYGPYDYRHETHRLEIVERAHFTPEVEAGVSGNTSYLGDDLQYTLQASPNHHRALVTLGKLAVRDKTVHIPHMKYPVGCYFERAQRFAPDDGMVPSIYGGYLFALGKKDEALVAYKRAYAMMPDDAVINYNLGLLYTERKDYEHALPHAEKAYALGFPLPGLKKKLLAAGKWQDKPEDEQTDKEEAKQADKQEAKQANKQE